MSISGRTRAFTWDVPAGVVALIAAALCLVPVIGFLLAWHQQVDLVAYTRFATVPALILLGACEYYLTSRSRLLFNRFAAGLVGGLIATLVFDLVRFPAAYLFKGAPDFVPMIGQYLTHETIGIAPTLRAVLLGYGYHYLLNGALIGAAYSLALGKGRWYWGTVLGAIAAVGFVLLPQAQLLTVATGFNLGLTSMIWAAAFLCASTVLGLLVQRLGRTAANAFYVVFMREELVETPELVAAGQF